MKIEKQEKVVNLVELRFRDIPEGSVLSYNDGEDYFMKMPPFLFANQTMNAVNLTTGSPMLISNQFIVNSPTAWYKLVPSAKLVVE